MKYLKKIEDFINENNIYVNKYHLETIRNPIIPDAIKVITKNPDAIKFSNKEEFNTFAGTQSYFSLSCSHCFQNEEEEEYFHKNGSKYKTKESENSKLCFETGREIVQVWDELNNIGYIIPGKIKNNK